MEWAVHGPLPTSYGPRSWAALALSSRIYRLTQPPPPPPPRHSRSHNHTPSPSEKARMHVGHCLRDSRSLFFFISVWFGPHPRIMLPCSLSPTSLVRFAVPTAGPCDQPLFGVGLALPYIRDITMCHNTVITWSKDCHNKTDAAPAMSCRPTGVSDTSRAHSPPQHRLSLAAVSRSTSLSADTSFHSTTDSSAASDDEAQTGPAMALATADGCGGWLYRGESESAWRAGRAGDATESPELPWEPLTSPQHELRG